MTRTSHALQLAAAVLCACAVGNQAAAQVAGALVITHPWIRPVPAGAPTAAGYLTITNRGKTPDRLTGVETSAAASVEIHRTTMTGSVMRMRAVPEGVELPVGKTVGFDPGGYHLMFIGPKRAFRAGEHIAVTLRFLHAPAARTEFTVEQPAPAAGGMPGMTMKPGDHM